MTMKALWLEDRSLSIRDDLPRPLPSDDEALVRVLQAGICNTDLEMIRGYYPFSGILGHEFVGVVEEGPQRLLGRRVVGEINISCGVCGPCRRGHRTHCTRRQVLGLKNRDGAFAEFLTLPTENLHEVPDTVTSEAATFAEPLAAALQIQEQVPIGPDDRVLIVGSGKLGRLIAQTLALTGCSLQIVGRREQRLPLPSSKHLEVVMAAEVSAGSFDIAVECTGNPRGFSIARQALRPRGCLVMKSTYAGSLEVDSSSLVVDEITLIGSRCGPFGPALTLLAEGLVDVAPLVDARFTLGDGLQAIERAQRSGALKVLLQMGTTIGQEC